MTRLSRAIALTLALFPVLAIADEATATFQVSVTVVASCRLQTQPLVFASYITGGPAIGTATPGSIDVSCTQGTDAVLYLDGKQVMTGPNGAQVAYTLQANGQPWSAGESLSVKGRGKEAVHLTISGSVNAGQQVPVGDYAGEEVVRVIY